MIDELSKFKLSIISRATSTGSTLGWPLNSLSDYMIIDCSKSCYDHSINGKETIHLIIHFGACLGALVPPCVADNIGRQNSLGLSATLCAISWSILAFAKDNTSIIVGSMIGGLSTGIFVVTTTVYISEISPSNRRRIIAALVELFSYVGTCLSLYFSEDRVIPVLMIFISFLFLITIYKGMIESPYYLYQCNKTLEAKLALKYLRNVKNLLDIDKDYKLIQEVSRNNGICQLLPFKRNGKMLMSIAFMFLCCTQIIGNYAMDLYTDYYIDTIFPSYGFIFVPFLNVVSIGICIYLIGKIGRGPVLYLSLFGYTISCLVLALDTLIDNIYSYYNYYCIHNYLMAIVFLLYRGSSSLGLIPFIPLLTGELFPNRIKTIAIGFFISGIYLATMISQVIFEIINFEKGSDIAIMSFGSLSIIFVYLFISKIQTGSFYDDEIDECAVPAMI